MAISLSSTGNTLTTEKPLEVYIYIMPNYKSHPSTCVHIARMIFREGLSLYFDLIFNFTLHLDHPNF